MNEEKLIAEVQSAIMDTYNSLGVGFPASAYEEYLSINLTERSLKNERHVSVPLIIEGQTLSENLQADLLVEGLIPVLVKSVEETDKETEEMFQKELLTIIRLSHLKHGFLVNFNTTDIAHSILSITDNFTADPNNSSSL